MSVWTWLMSRLNRCDCGRKQWASFDGGVECQACLRTFETSAWPSGDASEEPTT